MGLNVASLTARGTHLLSTEPNADPLEDRQQNCGLIVHTPAAESPAPLDGA